MKTANEIWQNGISLADYPIDIDLNGEHEFNGSVEHLMACDGNFYYLQKSWDGNTFGRVAEINKDEEIKEGGWVADEIIKYETH